jgi:hypothetical protein
MRVCKNDKKDNIVCLKNGQNNNSTKITIVLVFFFLE